MESKIKRPSLTSKYTKKQLKIRGLINSKKMDRLLKKAEEQFDDSVEELLKILHSTN